MGKEVGKLFIIIQAVDAHGLSQDVRDRDKWLSSRLCFKLFLPELKQGITNYDTTENELFLGGRDIK